MMYLASVISYTVLWTTDKENLSSLYSILSPLLVFLSYFLFCRCLNTFEKRASSSIHHRRWETLSQYSQILRRSEISWRQAMLYAATVAIFGFGLTIFVPPPWSSLVPVLQVLFEVCQALANRCFA